MLLIAISSECFNCTFLFWTTIILLLFPISFKISSWISHCKWREEGRVEHTAVSGCGSAAERCQSSPATRFSMDSWTVGSIQLHRLLRTFCLWFITEQLCGLTYPFSARMCLGATAQLLQWGHIWLPKDTPVGPCESQPPKGNTQLSCCQLPYPSSQSPNSPLLHGLGRGVSHVQ